MAPLVYSLCAATAFACYVLLLRGYLQTHSRLLLWAGVAFAGFAISHVILVFDLVIVRDFNLYPWRNLTTLASVAVLLYGLIWESK